MPHRPQLHRVLYLRVLEFIDDAAIEMIAEMPSKARRTRCLLAERLEPSTNELGESFSAEAKDEMRAMDLVEKAGVLVADPAHFASIRATPSGRRSDGKRPAGCVAAVRR